MRAEEGEQERVVVCVNDLHTANPPRESNRCFTLSKGSWLDISVSKQSLSYLSESFQAMTCPARFKAKLLCSPPEQHVAPEKRQSQPTTWVWVGNSPTRSFAIPHFWVHDVSDGLSIASLQDTSTNCLQHSFQLLRYFSENLGIKPEH